MKHLLALCALLLCLGSAAVARPVAPDPYVPQQNWHAMLSADDQRDFDNYYGKWMEATRKNDRDAMSENTRKMQDIMTRNNIPADVSFDQVASASAYPNPAYSASVPAQRLSADDQKDFDKYYAKWTEATRKNHQEDISENARKMQDIMARYNIPASVPFAQVASGGTQAAYPNTAYVPAYSQGQRLSSDDQKEFDKAYKKWLESRHKKHTEDMAESERKMRDIMARYNIPANVSFDQIASPGIYR
ncbi:MAG: hypothetical protein DMG62_12220 [Acidobacteria bacterium]|nr:MAG: hypothetical protein DMG62_12220 [Acidobacteriota bacterium]